MGGNLFDWMKRKNASNEKDAIRAMKQLLSAVVYLHNKNVAHRDLKPENILMESTDSNSTLKIIDFGTSQIYEPGQKMTDKVGTPLYMAPEVITKSYTEKCDVWSSGVILYYLLSGAHPFSARTERDVFKKIQTGKFSFIGSRWIGVSEESKNLIRAMLEINPDKRCTAEDALNSEIIRNIDKATLDLKEAKNQLNGIQDYKAKHKLQQAALTFITSQLISSKEKGKFQKMFLMLDNNKDGKVNRDELINGFKKIYGEGSYTDKEIQEMIDQVDIDGSGCIDLTEFVIATMNKRNMLSRDKLLAAFDMFDKDRSGMISAKEVKEVLLQEVEIPEENWQSLIREVDTNGDGVISLTEFITMMKKLLDS